MRNLVVEQEVEEGAVAVAPGVVDVEAVACNLEGVVMMAAAVAAAAVVVVGHSPIQYWTPAVFPKLLEALVPEVVEAASAGEEQEVMRLAAMVPRVLIPTFLLLAGAEGVAAAAVLPATQV